MGKEGVLGTERPKGQTYKNRPRDVPTRESKVQTRVDSKSTLLKRLVGYFLSKQGTKIK